MGSFSESGSGCSNGNSYFANPSIANQPHDVALLLRQPFEMMQDPVFERARARLLLACELTGLTPSALAKAANVAVTTVTRPINRKTDSVPSSRTMDAVDAFVRRHVAMIALTDNTTARTSLDKWEGRTTGGMVHVDIHKGAITIAVRGTVQAGVWADADELPVGDWEFVTVPAPNGYEDCYGLRVRGNSMNMEYPEGSILVCVPIHKYRQRIVSGDHVIVRRWNDCSQVEATVKELLLTPDGRQWLCPKSTDPQWTPLLIPDTPPGFAESGSCASIEIIAVVVADYRIRKPLPAPSL